MPSIASRACSRPQASLIWPILCTVSAQRVYQAMLTNAQWILWKALSLAPKPRRSTKTNQLRSLKSSSNSLPILPLVINISIINMIFCRDQVTAAKQSFRKLLYARVVKLISNLLVLASSREFQEAVCAGRAQQHYIRLRISKIGIPQVLHRSWVITSRLKSTPCAL